MRSEQSWSLLDPKPVLLYLQNVDEYIVYWNGIAMIHTMALNMALEQFGVYATPEMKTSMEQDYRKVYYANGFETRKWDFKVSESPIYPYVKRLMMEHLKTNIAEKNKPISEVLGWFDYSRARKHND
jgi:cobalamin biosynthesis Co2+ chelatase CbiK